MTESGNEDTDSDCSVPPLPFFSLKPELKELPLCFPISSNSLYITRIEFFSPLPISVAQAVICQKERKEFRKKVPLITLCVQGYYLVGGLKNTILEFKNRIFFSFLYFCNKNLKLY